MILKEGDTFELGSYDELHPGRFLKAGHLKGKPLTLTVVKFYGEHMGTKKNKDTGVETPDIKGIMVFKEIPQHYATQKTNEHLIRAMFGADPKGVIGKQITFEPAKDMFGKEQVDAIRVAGSPHLTEPLKVVVTYAKKSRRPDKHFTLRPTGQQRAREESKPTVEECPSAETVSSVLGRLEVCSDHKALDEYLDLIKGTIKTWPFAYRSTVRDAVKAKRAALGGDQ